MLQEIPEYVGKWLAVVPVVDEIGPPSLLKKLGPNSPATHSQGCPLLASCWHILGIPSCSSLS